MQLRKIFTRCKLWGVRFEHEPIWKRHWLAVPDERVREVTDDEADRLEAAISENYRPFVEFARTSGWRLSECVLKWSEVDWGARQITKLGKGNRRVTMKITPTIREILWPLRGHHPVYVFTRAVKGERRPVTASGAQEAWGRLCKRVGIVGLRFHDLRHDFATKLLRVTGNLKIVQKALNHRDIKTTTRYAHVLDNEVAEGLERVAQLRKNRGAARKVA